ncbi:T9SS type A sorting domain-containing protein [Terrimonas rubra]|uniref:T9SS type A sorting domain-containing protein n=1 Tax=Terrimonas rubra TaxID=1035890 RepID=A0ABW6A3N6_9BACT
MKITLRIHQRWQHGKAAWLLLLKSVPLLLAFLFTATTLLAQVNVKTGKSFINISRPGGGTFLAGDIIEVRATIAVNGGSSNDNTYVNSIRYNDTINTNKFQYITGSLRMLSNEGVQQATFTDAAGDDLGNIQGALIRFNIGGNATNANVTTQTNSTTGAGRLRRSDVPSFYGGTCIRMYTYQIQIKSTATDVALDSLIILNAGNFRYRIGSSTTDVLSNFQPYRIRIAPDYGLCSSSFGTNAILGEAGGTFGSGTVRNKAGGTTFVPLPYNRVNFSASAPQDNDYGVANNTSSDGSSNPFVAYPNSARVHSVWDIIGDHTGAADPVAGNAPTPAGNNGGYTLVINASYETNLAFRQNITNLCEETYYEFSAWFRNICRRCGCDVTGRGSGDPGYTPGAGNDSSGVKPNLSFQIDGEEYYTSGNIAYSGQWVKKGFVFKTKPGQTSFTVTIRNNAPGGGGNDWAIDDIAVATCLPNMSYSPSLTPNICVGNPITIYDTVRSYFDNYRYYQWQYMADGTSTWTNIGSPVGPVTPVNNAGTWEYVAQHTIPPASTTTANSGDRYRLVVATSTTNLLNDACRSTDIINAVTLNVLTCTPTLGTNLLSFNATLQSDHVLLNWTTSREAELLYFDIERSANGIHFEKVSTVNSASQYAREQNEYRFTDNQPNSGKMFYRVRMYNQAGKTTYSKIISLGRNESQFTVNAVMNPFNQEMRFDITATQKETITVELTDYYGKKIKQTSFDIQVGNNILKWNGMNNLPYGMYIVRLTGKSGKTSTHKLVKSARP